MVADWDRLWDSSNQKNVFTEEEYEYLVEHWQFDPELFVKEEVPEYEYEYEEELSWE